MPDFFPWWVVITHFLNIFLLSVHDLARSRNRHREIGLHAAHCGGGGSRRRDNTTDQQAEAGEQPTRQHWQQAREGPFKVRKSRGHIRGNRLRLVDHADGVERLLVVELRPHLIM
jgi:hypothetical protein